MPRLALRIAAAAAPDPDPDPRLPAFLRRHLRLASERLALPMADIPIEEIAGGFDSHEGDFPPVLSLKQACKLAHVGESTLKRWVREKKFRGSVKTKKPLLFWRNRFVKELMSL
jgi:hypothetical protein